MKTFDILYKRTKTGAIQYYKVWVDSGDIDHAPIIAKESGQLGTLSPVLHRETIHQGVNLGKANETTALQQAHLQAESDWKKKLDSGYKSLGQLGISHDLNNAKDIYTLWLAGIIGGTSMNIGTLSEMLELVLPQFNSDASGNIKPMLAKDWKKVKNIEYPQIIEPKLDGVRCLMIVKPDDGGEIPQVTFLSRSGKEYTTLNHIARTIEDSMDELPVGEFILDGEIYSDELTFQEITAAVKKQSLNSTKLHFRAYDIVNDKPMMERRVELIQLVASIGSDFIIPIVFDYAYDETSVKEVHDNFVQAGYEGAMLRHPKGKYEQGFRSSHLLKVKEFMEEEFDLLNLEYGQRGQEDLIALCATGTGDEFRAKIQGTKEQKLKLESEYFIGNSEMKDYKLTVKFFGWTDKWLPRFPIGKGIRDYE